MAAMLPFIQGVQPASAELPMIQEPPWLGYFAVAEEPTFNFIFAAQQGGIGIMVRKKGGAQIEAYPITLQFLAQETLPDGSVRDLLMNPDTLESADPATAKLKKTVFRSKLTDQATGQPTIEVTLEIARGTVLANARITDKGAFDKNPLRPVIRAGFTAFYLSENSVKAKWDKKQIKEFEKLIGKDSVTLKRLDGTQVKLGCVDKTDPKSKEVNGTGSSSVEVEINAYQNRKIEFLAAPNSSLTLINAAPAPHKASQFGDVNTSLTPINAAPAPLQRGFWFQWSADSAKDPESKAKLAIKIK